MRFAFATNNQHKLDEISAILGAGFELISAAGLGCTEEIPETGNTLEDNASQKAFYLYNKYGANCFADDTGLEIEALGGKPGVISARYAGPGRNAADNMKKVLEEMAEIKNRKARFRTVISLVVNGEETLFEGIVNGSITYAPRGSAGFGYDPIFQPDGFETTFGEMAADVKNKISHRAVAVQRLVIYLQNLAKMEDNV